MIDREEFYEMKIKEHEGRLAELRLKLQAQAVQMDMIEEKINSCLTAITNQFKRQ